MTTYKLFKIVVDDKGTAGDGSDAKKHSELVFEGTDPELRQKLLELQIAKQVWTEKAPISALQYFCSIKGFIISKGEN